MSEILFDFINSLNKKESIINKIAIDLLFFYIDFLVETIEKY